MTALCRGMLAIRCFWRSAGISACLSKRACRSWPQNCLESSILSAVHAPRCPVCCCSRETSLVASSWWCSPVGERWHDETQCYRLGNKTVAVVYSAGCPRTTQRSWVRLRAMGMILHHCMMTSSNGNIFRVTGQSCGEFTGHRWIPRTKASDAALWGCLWSLLNKRLSKLSWSWWFETPSTPLWRHCNVWNTPEDMNGTTTSPG